MPGTKDDRRSRYSRMVIREALFSLLDKKPLNKISVTEICQLADVNRSTFYKYYTDVFDLNDKILEEFSEKQKMMISECVSYVASLPDPRAMTRKDFYRIMFVFFASAAENEALYRFIYGINSSNDVLHDTGNKLFKALEPIVLGGKSANAKMVSAYIFVTGGITAMLMEWLERGCPDSPESQSHRAANYLFDVLASETARERNTPG